MMEDSSALSPMKKVSSKPLTAKQKRELAALARLADDKIDTRATPAVKDWSGAKRGLFYRPVKQQLTLRLDADVIAWFKDHAPKGRGYQSDINRALRDHVQRRARKAGRPKSDVTARGRELPRASGRTHRVRRADCGDIRRPNRQRTGDGVAQLLLFPCGRIGCSLSRPAL